MIRGALVPLAIAGLAFAGCQSTQDTSEMKSRRARGLAKEEAVSVGPQNQDVTVAGTTILHDPNGVAAVVELRSRAKDGQASVPLGLTLTDRAGKQLYTNTISGLDASLTSVSYLAGRERAYWVDNQITSATVPRRAKVQVGRAKAEAPSSVPRIELSGVRFDEDNSGTYAAGTVVNRSKIEQKRLVITCVARRGGKIVAAGRAIIDRVPPGVQKKPIRWRVYFIGNPKGAKLELSAPPTVLR